MTAPTAKRTQDSIVPTGSGPTRDTSAIRELSARFDLMAITLIGSAHNGAWHRAIDVARRLVDAGVWNGVDPIEFDAYDLQTGSSALRACIHTTSFQASITASAPRKLHRAGASRCRSSLYRPSA